jgi:hypothetical protein
LTSLPGVPPEVFEAQLHSGLLLLLLLLLIWLILAPQRLFFGALPASALVW